MLVLSLILAVLGIVFGIKCRDFQLPGVIGPYAPIAVLIVEVLAVVGGIVAVRILLDDEPKLVIGPRGIEDYRVRDAPRYIPWEAVENMDYELTTVNGSVTKARVTIYVVEDEGEVKEVKVNVARLSKGPKKVFGILKKAWIQFNYERKRTLDAEE